jgi:abequosyltransferase
MRLSIAIPTYNFGRFLGATLDSILPQVVAFDDVEVVVVDGASTDNTADVVRARQASSPRLRYVRLTERGGIDIDIAHAVDTAAGAYCWLFSADDLMQPGAVARALAAIGDGDDVVLARHLECALDMTPLEIYPVFATAGPRRANLGDPQERVAWLEAAVTTEALFSFMSTLVLRRETWRSAAPPSEMVGGCWAHVARLLAVAAGGSLRTQYVDEVWVARRGDNDSFAANGPVRRMALSIDGFLAIAARFFGAQSRESAAVRRMLRKEWTLPIFFETRRRCRLERREIDRLFDAIYSDAGARVIASRIAYHGSPPQLGAPLSAAYIVAGKALRWMRRRDG